MPLPFFSLDSFEFINMHVAGNPAAPPPYPQRSNQLITRPGVDGHAFVFTGVKAPGPFPLRTFVDVATEDDAATLVNLYKTLVCTGAYNIIWKGVNYEQDHLTLFVVNQVDAVRVKKVAAAAGGFVGGWCVAVECLWTLTPIPKPSE